MFLFTLKIVDKAVNVSFEDSIGRYLAKNVKFALVGSGQIRHFNPVLSLKVLLISLPFLVNVLKVLLIKVVGVESEFTGLKYLKETLFFGQV
jgi:hypothetical protein